jgi:hypothetical protein
MTRTAVSVRLIARAPVAAQIAAELAYLREVETKLVGCLRNGARLRA